MQKVKYHDWGLIDYQKAWDSQTELFDGIVAQKSTNRKSLEAEQRETQDYLIFCSHPHVYTLGKSGDMSHLLIDNQKMEDEGISYYKINRGGDITYHGPGQVVAYPIFNLDHYFTDIHKYLRTLEEAVILTLKEFGLTCGRSDGETGVWLDAGTPFARKICAMGVRASRWVTMHGLALNVNTDLKYFGYIVPCGISDKAVTTMKTELGKEVDEALVKERLKHHLAEQFKFSYL